MFTEKTTYLVLGIVLLVSPIGCKSTHHRDVTWGNDMASNANYAPPLPVDEWVCSMHPMIKQSEPGTCSICGMDLVRSNSPRVAHNPAPTLGHSHSSGSSHSGSPGGGCCGG